MPTHTHTHMSCSFDAVVCMFARLGRVNVYAGLICYAKTPAHLIFYGETGGAMAFTSKISHHHGSLPLMNPSFAG